MLDRDHAGIGKLVPNIAGPCNCGDEALDANLSFGRHSKLLKGLDLACNLVGIQETSTDLRVLETLFSAHLVLLIYYRHLSEWPRFTSYRATFFCCFPSEGAEIYPPHHHIIRHDTVCLAYLQQLKLRRKAMLSCHVTKRCFTVSSYSHRSLFGPKCAAANLSSLFLYLNGSKTSFLKLPYL